MSEVSFVLNGENIIYSGNPSLRLLDVLRDEYRLTSVKCGCKEGECGACSVLIEGKLRNSCCVSMGSLKGLSVMTLEGEPTYPDYEIGGDIDYIDVPELEGEPTIPDYEIDGDVDYIDDGTDGCKVEDGDLEEDNTGNIEEDIEERCEKYC